MDARRDISGLLPRKVYNNAAAFCLRPLVAQVRPRHNKRPACQLPSDGYSRRPRLREGAPPRANATSVVISFSFFWTILFSVLFMQCTNQSICQQCTDKTDEPQPPKKNQQNKKSSAYKIFTNYLVGLRGVTVWFKHGCQILPKSLECFFSREMQLFIAKDHLPIRITFP